MEISASEVKKLREQTGAGMMNCKQALTACNGDFIAAIKWLEEHALVVAAKKSDLTAAEGAIFAAVADDRKEAVLLEVNTQTDFAGRNQDFLDFANKVAARALSDKVNDCSALLNIPFEPSEPQVTIDQKCQQQIAKIGENIVIRRCRYFSTDDTLGVYIHNKRIGVVVEIKGGSDKLCKDIAMHIAASAPLVIHENDIPATSLQDTKNDIIKQLSETGKPSNIVQQMLQDEVNHYLDKTCLLRQPFILDPNQSVEQYMTAQKATVQLFCRFELGEGIEKQSTDFVAEVMAQIRG